MRRKIAVLGSLLAAGLLRTSAAEAAVALNVGSASGNPGDTVTVSVTLTTSAGEQVAGTQNDIAFDADAPIGRKANGKPDCAVNPDIEKGGTSFAFRPAGCTEGTCTGIRALVLSTEDTTAIPNGSDLYSCKVVIPASASGGAKPLTISGVIASDPSGARIAGADGTNGTITVSGEEPPSSCPEPRPAPAGPALYIADQNLEAGSSSATIEVKLAAGAAQVAGTQNDIAFAPGVTVNRKANGKPDCTVNSEIDKGGTSFAFRPAGCTEGTCTGIRALVLSTENTDAIPDGAVLYTCNVTVSGEGGELEVSGIILSTPAGTRVEGASSQSGRVCIGGTIEPPVGCAEPRPAPQGPALYVNDQNLPSGSTSGTIEVKLAAGEAQVAGTQNDIAFAAGATINRKANGKPDCTVNPGIDKGGTSFAFRPAGCTEGTCTGIRALVLSTENTDAIPDGSVLYTCNVTVSTGGELDVSGVILSSPAGSRIEGATGRSGILCVEGAVVIPPTPTEVVPTATFTATVVVPTNTVPPVVNTPTATAPKATVTATHTRVPATRTPGGVTYLEDEGGCHISGSSNNNGWLLLLPLAGLLIVRRRSR